MWNVGDVGCSGCGIFEMWDVRDVECSGNGMWDVFRDVGTPLPQFINLSTFKSMKILSLFEYNLVFKRVCFL